MKNLFNRIISLICAVTLLICVLSVCAAAENEPASFTDLQEANLSEEQPEVTPENDQDETEAGLDETGDRSEDNDEKEPEAEPGEEDASDESSDGPVDSVEILITKTMILGESWEGRTRNTRLVVLKLDIEKEQTVHMIVEGKNTWANVQKSDRTEENLRKVLTDPETKRAIITWEAEEGSYLITIGPEEPNLMSNAKVTFLDNEAYAAWEEVMEEETEEEATEKEITEEKVTEETKPVETKTVETKPVETKPVENEPVGNESVQTEETTEELTENTKQEDNENTDTEDVPEEVFELPADRSVKLQVTWDNEHPDYGDVAHFHAILHGYDNIEYLLQWQNSVDGEYWTDVTGATEDQFDIVYTAENGDIHWRVLVYIILPEEEN